VGVTRQVVDRLLADRTLAFRCGQKSTAASESVMSRTPPKNVIVVIRATERFASRCESLPIGPVCRPVATLRLRSGMSLRGLYRAGRGGIVREPEGVATPLPGRS
jgi:hypothetical protein